MIIPGPEPTKKDIYSFGFSPTMMREIKTPHSSVVYDALSNAVDTGQIPSGGNLTLKTLNIGGFIKMVSPGDDIQAAIDSVNREGGGTIRFQAGNYEIQTPLTGYSSINFEGVSPQTTTIDFVGSAANLSFSGSDVYATGTITVASGVSITGSGTSWLANVRAGQHLFIGTRWYEIAAVTSDTTLVLAEAYGDSVTLPSTYRIASVITNVVLRDLIFKNSSGTGVTFTDARRLTLDKTYFLDNNKGAVFTNCSEINSDQVLYLSNTSNGVELTNVGLSDWESTNAAGNGGSGMVLNNVKTMTFMACASSANTVDGFNVTTGSELSFLVATQSNGGQGMEFVSGNDNCAVFNGSIQGNTSDGIKLTATSDNIKIYGNEITGNGGYGINVTASTDDNTLIFGNRFASNVTAALNDAGTGTVVRGNSGLADSGGTVDSEAIADVVGTMVTGNTETNITVTYQDADNTLDFVVPAASETTAGVMEVATAAEVATGTDNTRAVTPAKLGEGVADIVGAMVTGNTETGITVTYQDADNTIDFVVSDTTFAGDTGSIVATPGETVTIAGGTGLTTSVSANTLTVNGDTASTTAVGVVELATAAETTTGTDATRAVTPDGLAGSDFGKKACSVIVVAPTTDTATGDGKAYFPIPDGVGGMNLILAHAYVVTAGTTNTTTVQIHNLTQAADMLSTRITIDSTETSSRTAATAPVIDTLNDDVADGDIIRIDVDAVHTTPAKGLMVELVFQLP